MGFTVTCIGGLPSDVVSGHSGGVAHYFLWSFVLLAICELTMLHQRSSMARMLLGRGTVPRLITFRATSLTVNMVVMILHFQPMVFSGNNFIPLRARHVPSRLLARLASASARWLACAGFAIIVPGPIHRSAHDVNFHRNAYRCG
jgi:hypothetical protein